MDYNGRLNEIKQELDVLGLSDNAIDYLERLINEADDIAKIYKLDSLEKNIRETRYKCLDHLLDYKEKPRKRILWWGETITHFRADLSDHLGRLPSID